MKFNIYEYREELNYQESKDNIIVEYNYIFIHEEKYSDKFPNKFKDNQGNEANTDYPEQLKKQVFILINKNNKHIYSYEASLKNTKELIKQYLGINLEVYYRLEGGIDGFINKLNALKKIHIKGDGDVKLPIVEKFLNDNEDLSKYDEINIILSYTQKNQWFKKQNYQKLQLYDLSDIKLEGESENSIISFDKDKILEHIQLEGITKNENNIYSKDDVFSYLKNKLQ